MLLEMCTLKAWEPFRYVVDTLSGAWQFLAWRQRPATIPDCMLVMDLSNFPLQLLEIPLLVWTNPSEIFTSGSKAPSLLDSFFWCKVDCQGNNLTPVYIELFCLQGVKKTLVLLLPFRYEDSGIYPGTRRVIVDGFC